MTVDTSAAAAAPAIHFFEEYPTPDSLKHAALVRFPALVFLAARDRHGFDIARDLLRERNAALTAAWWPVPHRSLTLSSLADPEEIEALELALREPDPRTVLLDLEAPLWDRGRLIRGLISARQRRHAARALDRLMATACSHHSVWVAQYPPALPHWLTSALRLELQEGAATPVFMLYSTLLPRWWRALLARPLARRPGSGPWGVAVGTLATGVAGDEPILSPEAFARDLAEAAQMGASAIVVYRLGGLTEAHAARLDAFRAGSPGVSDA